MSSGVDTIVNFILDEKNKQIRDLIELAIEGNDEALNYIDFISNEIKKKFKQSSDNALSLPPMRLNIEIDPKKGQKELKAIDKELKFQFNKFGKLITSKNNNENENENKEEFTDEISKVSYIKYIDELSSCITKYLFYILSSSYKFRSKNIGMKISKKKKQKIDFEYKTLLFSKSFDNCDSIIVLIAPKRASISYTSLCIEQGIAYGTMIPYIDDILNLNNDKETKKYKWGILVMDPQGKDANNNKYSIIKIFDKWLSKRIPSLGLLQSFGIKEDKEDKDKEDDNNTKHKRTDSGESIQSNISVTSDKNKRSEIKNLYFIGALNNGQWISHLMHRRGSEMKNVIKGCIFLGSDDPYDVNDMTKTIYNKCAINFVNSGLQAGTKLEGKKLNGESFIIQRVSAGNTKYCVVSAKNNVIKYIKDQLKNNGDQRPNDEESKNDN